MSAGRGGRGGKLWADEETVGKRARAWSNFPLDPPSETVRLTWAFYLRLDFLRLTLPPSPALHRPPFSSSASPPENPPRSSNGRSATRSDLTRITVAIERKASKRSAACDSPRLHRRSTTAATTGRLRRDFSARLIIVISRGFTDVSKILKSGSNSGCPM